MSPKHAESQVLRAGRTQHELKPHVLPGVGPRVFVVISEDADAGFEPGRVAYCYTPAELRLLADGYKSVACQAEEMGKHARPLPIHDKGD